MTERIAIFMQDLKGGGAERVMTNLAIGLSRLGVPVDMVLVRREGPYLSLLPASVRVVHLRTGRVIHSVLALRRYLRTERPAALVSALVHVNTAAILAGLLARTGTRIVVSEHNDVGRDHAHTDSRTVALAFRSMPFVYRWADRILAVSHGVAESLARAARVPRRRVEVVYNPVVTDAMRQQAAEAPGHPWLAPDEPPVILAIGRLEMQKDFPTLLRAFALLRERRRVRLMILGEGSRRGELESLVRTLGLEADVCLRGFVSNPFAYLARARLLALSSQWEGLPTVIIEALACGTPVVSTDCPSGPAEILDGGRFGRLVPPADPLALADALDATLEQPPSPELLRARAEMFTVDQVAERYREILLGEPASA